VCGSVERSVQGFCKHGNEPSSSMKTGIALSVELLSTFKH
jgi:hypothetical protein